MKQYSAHSLIRLGDWLQRLRNIDHRTTFGALRTGVANVGKDLKAFSMTVSRQYSLEVVGHLKKFASRSINEAIGKEVASDFIRLITDWQKIIATEARTRNYFFVTQRRYKIEHLIENPDQLLARYVFFSLPETSRFDFAESARCLAHGCGTAAVFHLLRATEVVLKDAYCHTIKSHRLNNPDWASMLAHFRKRKNGTLPAPLIDILGSIHKRYRNPASRPDVTYLPEQAEDLFGLCIEVINQLHKHRDNDEEFASLLQ